MKSDQQTRPVDPPILTVAALLRLSLTELVFDLEMSWRRRGIRE